MRKREIEPQLYDKIDPRCLLIDNLPSASLNAL